MAGFLDTILNELITEGISQGIGFFTGQAEQEAAEDLQGITNQGLLDLQALKDEGALERLLKELVAQQEIEKLRSATSLANTKSQAKTAGFDNLLKGILGGRGQEQEAFKTLANAGRF